MTGLILTTETIGEIARIDEAARGSRAIVEKAEADGNDTVKAFAIAAATQQIREMITDEMLKAIMSLQGSALGFKSDKDRDGGYSAAIVKDVFIEATLRGFQMVGDEVNIISGRFYGARNGWKRKVEQLPGVRNVVLTMGRCEPNTKGPGQLVTCKASWTLNGQPDEILCSPDGEFDSRLSVKQNSGQADDAILGKAERKLYKKVYEKITGRGADYDDDNDPVHPYLDKPDNSPEAKNKRNWDEHLSKINREFVRSRLLQVRGHVAYDPGLSEDQRVLLLAECDEKLRGELLTRITYAELVKWLEQIDPSDEAERDAWGKAVAGSVELSDENLKNLRKAYAEKFPTKKPKQSKTLVELLGRIEACDLNDERAVKILQDDANSAGLSESEQAVFIDTLDREFAKISG